MMSIFSKILHFSLVAIFTISISAEYKLGRDYKLIDNPLPVKKDGIVEVTESFWYGCYACYSFEPAVMHGKQNLDLMLNSEKCQFLGHQFIGFMQDFTTL